MIIKKCRICKKEKEINEFYPRHGNEDGLRNECKQCGESHISCLVFHHRNPKEKNFTIAKMVSGKMKKELILEEIKKCDVLCANCHRKLHWSHY
jgi:hypothetical protein